MTPAPTAGRRRRRLDGYRKVRSLGKRELRRRYRLAGARVRAGLSPRTGWPDVERYFLIVGHPRSGSTLLAALLDANDRIGVGHEGEILRAAVDGGSRHSLLARTHHHCAEFRALGFQWEGYDYRIGADQGRPAGCALLGDKSAGRAAELLAARPDAVDVLRSTLALPVDVIALERNPLDVVATMLRKGGAHVTEREAVARHRRRVDAVTALEGRDPGVTHVVHHADLCADPAAVLTDLLGRLGVPASPAYLGLAVGGVDPTPRRRSLARTWTPETLDVVAELCATTERLDRYLPELDELRTAPR